MNTATFDPELYYKPENFEDLSLEVAQDILDGLEDLTKKLQDFSDFNNGCFSSEAEGILDLIARARRQLPQIEREQYEDNT